MHSYLTTCAGMTCHARREFFIPKSIIFPQSQAYLKQIINLLLHNNFYPVISYQRVQKESDKLLYMVWVTRYGPQSVARANS